MLTADFPPSHPFILTDLPICRRHAAASPWTTISQCSSLPGRVQCCKDRSTIATRCVHYRNADDFFISLHFIYEKCGWFIQGSMEMYAYCKVKPLELFWNFWTTFNFWMHVVLLFIIWTYDDSLMHICCTIFSTCIKYHCWSNWIEFLIWLLNF